MTTTTSILLSIVLIRVVALCIAAVCLYLAYKLFFVNTDQQGCIEASGAGLSVKVRKVAPGVFFALVAAAIIVFSLRPLKYSYIVDTVTVNADGTTTRHENEQMAASAKPVEMPTPKVTGKR